MTHSSISYRMACYTQWADDIMLRAAEQLPDSELERPRETLFGSIAGTFDHILVVTEIFRAHLEARSHLHTARKRHSVLPFTQIASRLRRSNRHFVWLAQSMSDAELTKQVSFHFVDGGAGTMSREDILLHLANHATYHRGFVSTLLFTTAARPEASDLSVFLRDVWPTIAMRISPEAA